MPEVFVGCGSNIEPEANLRWAYTELEGRFGPLTASNVYLSAAYGFDGPDFLNMVLAFDTEQPVAAVEDVLSALETECGRDASGERTGSRTLDLDLLLYGQRVDPAWRLPREDILRYSFVLVPLAEIAPKLRHPLTGIAIGATVAAAGSGLAPLTRLGAVDAA
jgi:2-amino-4-hydroxy-6-hydroxymethyldihydropteridine diphosphokinase